MSAGDAVEDARRLLEAEGWVAYKPAPRPAGLPNPRLYRSYFVPAHTLVDYERSAAVDATARAVIDRGMRALNSKHNWRVIEQAFLAVRGFEGEVWEAGVFQGVTARLLAECVRRHGPADTKLRLFDTFAGMPAVDEARDLHRPGAFADTSPERVRAFVGEGVDATLHRGIIPATFAGLEGARLKLVHVDLDIYRAILDTLEFCYPRMERGVFVFDDYGTPSCPGALQAVDEFFAGRPETVFTFGTGQAMAVKFG